MQLLSLSVYIVRSDTEIEKLKYNDEMNKMFWNGNLNFNHAVLIQCFLILAVVYTGSGITFIPAVFCNRSVVRDFHLYWIR